MKVLQPLEVEKKKREEEAQKVQKAVKLHELVREEELSLNRARDEHRQKIEQLATNFLAFSKEIDERKALLGKEVEDLEIRKQKALEPLDQSLKEAQEKAKQILASEAELNLKRQKLSEDEKLLEEGRQKLKDKESELKQWEREMSEEQKATAIIKERTTNAALKLDKDKRFFDSWREKLVQNMDESDTLIQKERAEIETQRRLNDQQRIENQNELRRIQDQRATLQAAFEELKQKQNEQ